jgi:hypothetical protein
MSGVNADAVIGEETAEVDERGWDPAAHWEQIYDESNGISSASSLSLSPALVLNAESIFTAGLACLFSQWAYLELRRWAV